MRSTCCGSTATTDGTRRVAVVDRALLLCWRKGYQATSLADLTETMGIGRASFYAAFGDKRALFEVCLERFARRTQAILLDAMRERASRHLSDVQALFESGLARAGFAPQRARELAALLMVFNEGVRVSSRRRLPVPAQREPIEAAFRMIRAQVPGAAGDRGWIPRRASARSQSRSPRSAASTVCSTLPPTSTTTASWGGSSASNWLASRLAGM